MARRIKAIVSLLLAVILLSGFLPVPDFLPEAAAASSFSDVTNHWAKPAIERFAGLGVLKGVSGGRFHPDANITRAEFFAVLGRLFEVPGTASISQFSDVRSGDWFYADVQKAVKMGVTTGTSATTMSPREQISRQDACVMLGRSLGLFTDNTSHLSAFADRENISAYARGYVAAMVQNDYISGMPGGRFAPRDNLTRAQAVTIIDNMVSAVYGSEKSDFSNTTYTGTMLSNRAGMSLSNLTLNGNLILGDGVGTGDIAIRNSRINGKLIVRGGGPNSVDLTGTTVTGGIFVHNTNSVTRLVSSGSGSLGVLSARTGVTLEGPGFTSLIVQDDAENDAQYTLKNVSLESIDVNAPSRVTLDSRRVENFRINEGADGTRVQLDSGTTTSYMAINARNVSVTGTGTLSSLYVGAGGANVSMKPGTFSIADNVTATINGKAESGRVTSTADTNVDRSTSALRVTRYGSIGGSNAGLTFETSHSSSENRVRLTQSGTGTIVASSQKGRIAYWIAAFVPAPSGVSSSATIPTFQHAFDGLMSTSTNQKTTTSDGKTGLVIYLPVSRDDDDGYGYIDQSVYIRWNNTYRETLHFQANNLKLTALTTSQEESLVREFRNANFTGYHGEHYSGSEAIRRLLLTDNALGLSLRGFRTFAPGTQSNIAVQMNLVRDSFYTKEDIQSRLFVETSGKGALYAINRAMNAEQVKRILEDEGYADQLGIDARAGSKYYMLSQNGRLRVARAIILGRLGDYESEDKVKEVFDTNVDTIRIEETDLIVKINQTKSAEELQKLIENKANAAIIGIAVDVKPYSALTAADKLAVMRKIYSATPVSTLDRVRSIFLDMVGEPEEPGTDPGKPTDPKTISSVTTDKKTYEISRGQTITITPTVKTSDGQTYTDPSLVTWDYDGTNLTINSQGEATALSDVLKKTAVKVTVASTVNPAKKTTATVNIIPAIDAESLELRPSSLVEVTVGSKASITAILTPSNSNSTVTWSVDDENIASIASGMVTGKTPGFTTATAGIGALSLQASVPVAVLSAQPGVIIDRSTATIGVGEKLKLMAAVSPIGLSNRRISWSSSDTSVCSVASDGTVTGVAPANPEDVVRTATITAASVANPSLTATCVVTVDSSTKSITIVDEITMYAEERRVIPYSIFPVSAANEKVEWFITGGNTKGLELSTVGGTGDDADHAVVIAKSPGTYEISAQIRDTSVESRCKVVVSSTAMKLSLNKKALGMKIGDTEFLKVTFNPSTVYNSRVTWKSSHPEIASVDAEGKVTALKSGKATITAVSEAFPNYAVSELSCEVTVAKIPVTTFSLPETITVREEEVRKIEATILPENATNRTITWLRSPDEGKVIVHTDSGSIEGVQTTSRLVDKVVPDPTEQNPNQTKTIQVMEDFPVKITAICDDIERTCLVSVLPAGETIESINIELDNWVFPLGASPELVVKFFDKVDPATRQEIHPSNSILTWDSSSPDVIKFENNKLICSKPGIYAITATAYNGVYDTKYIAIGDTRIESLNVVGLNDYKGDYGNLLLLDMGPNSSKTLTVTPKQVTADEKGLLWNVVAGDDVIKVDAKTGEVTALKPGVAKIVIKPIQEYGYGMAKPSDDNVVAQKYGAKTIFTPGSGAKNPNTDAVLADKLMPLLVETEILDGTDTIYVQVTETAPTDVTFTGHANATVGKPLTITGKPAPTHAGVANATWRLVDNGGGVLETSDVTETAYTRDGGTSYQFTPKKPGTVKLELTVTLAAWEGLTKNPTYDMLRVAGPHTKVDATTVTRELTFEVKPAAVDSIRITKPAGDTLYSDLSIYQGEYELNPEASKGSPITWSSSNSSVLSIHETTGAITTGSVATPTEVTIRATAESGAYDEKTYTVKPQPKITLSETGKIPLTGTRTLTATVTNGSASDLRWEIRPAYAQASVTGDGTATATVKTTGASNGDTFTVVAWLSYLPEVTASCVFTVDENAPEIGTLMARGQFAPLALLMPKTAATEFASSNPSVVSVSDEGDLTALRVGTAEITATSKAKVETLTLDVADPAIPLATMPMSGGITTFGLAPITSIKLRPAFTIAAGATQTLVPFFEPADADGSGLEWKTSNDQVATVSGGSVSAVAKGSATITVTDSKTGKSATVKVTVVEADKAKPVTGISLSKTELTLKAGAAGSLSVTYEGTLPNIKGITWTSSDENVARVDQSGKIYALSGGSATITATSDNGVSTATCKVTVLGAVFAPDTQSVRMGSTGPLNALTVLPAGITPEIMYKSSSSRVLTVANDGTYTALKEGTATVTATVKFSGQTLTAKLTVTVIREPDSGIEDLTLPASKKVMMNQTLKLQPVVTPSNLNPMPALTWASSDPSVATVGSDGTVTPVKIGTTTITVTSPQGYLAAACKVTVTKDTSVKVTGISLNRSSATLKVGASLVITARLTPNGATNTEVIWTSSDDTIASVVNGKVTANNPGNVTITAEAADGGKTATCKITVTGADLRLSKTSATLDVGETLQLTANDLQGNPITSGITWSSSGGTVATVTAAGLVEAKKVGTATITATYNGKSATCKITVRDTTTGSGAVPVTGVSINRTTATLKVGQTLKITARITPNGASNQGMSWTSSGAAATVDSTGLVTATAIGSASITVTTSDGGKTATCIITVVASDVRLNKASLSLKKGDTYPLTASLSTDGSPATGSWASSHPDVASVSSSGVVTAIKAGGTTITFTSTDGKTAICKVVVTDPAASGKPVTGVSMNRSAATLKVGASLVITARITPNGATNQSVAWSSSAPGVATVDAKGRVTAVAPGEAEITVTTLDGSHIATCKIKVIIPVTKITPQTTTVAVGSIAKLNFSVTPTNATMEDISFRNQSATLLRVFMDGNEIKVEGLKAGTAKVTVTIDGRSTVCTVIVTA